jgi:hypothetical protein
MFVLNSNITIGIFKRVKPTGVKITKSIFEFVDKAVLKMPITTRIKRAGEIITASVETAKVFNEGDKVEVELGYNGILKTEFIGFISRVNFTSPLEVECEGYSYQLRKKTYLKTFVNTELIEILKYLITDTDIILDKPRIPQFVIAKLKLNNNTGVEALEMLKKISDKNISIFFTGNILYAGLQYLQPKADVKYRLGWNVLKDGNLKQRRASNDKITVNYIGEKKDGSKISVSAHSTDITAPVTKVITVHAITDEASLRAMANNKLLKLSFDGYEGKITAFGVPYCEPGYRAVVQDQKYKERSGNYIVQSTEINYDTSGFRRIVGIGAKL